MSCFREEDVLKLTRTPALRRRGANHAADREGSPSGRIDSSNVFRIPKCASWTRFASRPSNGRTRPSNWRSRCDVVIVIGGAHSNNTHELVETCGRYCRACSSRANGGRLDDDWFASANTVGITAGTSTPDAISIPSRKTNHFASAMYETTNLPGVTIASMAELPREEPNQTVVSTMGLKGIAIEPPLRKHRARSMQKFQLGESGEGRRLRSHARRDRRPVVCRCD